MAKLLMFYGNGCPHCHNIMPLVEKLEKELKVKIEKLEIWDEPKNLAKMKKVNTMNCTGVPYFFNKKTKKGICGAASYEELKTWAS